MSRVDRLRADIRRAVEAGHLESAKLAQARLEGYLMASGHADARCVHPRHRWIGERRGRPIWVCVACGHCTLDDQ